MSYETEKCNFRTINCWSRELCLSFFSYFCAKRFIQRQLRVERAYFSSKIIMAGKSEEQAIEASCHISSTDREKRVVNAFS